MKITIYELLGMVKDGKEPITIKYDGTIYKYDSYRGEEGYVDKTQYPYKWFEKEIDCDIKQYLNDEVEILDDEDELPQKIDTSLYYSDTGKLVATKINEIIDYLEKQRKGE